MSALEDFPLPAMARHDKDGNHHPPYIPEWRDAADPQSPAYEPNRVARGYEIERDQQHKAVFAAHLAEHRRRGENPVVIDYEETTP